MEGILSGVVNYNFFKMVFTLVLIVCMAVMGKGIFVEILPELISSIKSKEKENVKHYSKIMAVAVFCFCVSGYGINFLMNGNEHIEEHSLFKGD